VQHFAQMRTETHDFAHKTGHSEAAGGSPRSWEQEAATVEVAWTVNGLSRRHHQKRAGRLTDSGGSKMLMFVLWSATSWEQQAT
jgi:hypothetical protein